MIERRILIGLITSTEYCQKIKNLWDVQLLASTTAKRMATWCWEYYDEFKKAPGRDIEGIYYAKLKENKLPKDLAEDIEQDILPSLSIEYVREDFNLDYLVQETIKYFHVQQLKLLSASIETLATAGQLADAQQLIKEYVPISIKNDALSKHILSVPQIERKEVRPPRLLLAPWLRSSQLTIIYGSYGSGKSLLSIAIAYLLGLPATDDLAYMGEWFVKNPVGTLYVDGELGEQEMAERMACFKWLGKQQYLTKILSVPEYQLATEDTFYLSDRKNQLQIIQWLRDNPHYKLIVLDSVSTLFGLEEENNNSEWNNKVNPFLRDLRALDVACLLLHHAGKDNKRGLRGASAMGAMAHNIFRLSNHPAKNVDDGEAWFVLTKDKQRAAGKSFRTFGLQFIKDGSETHWEVTKIKND